MNWLNDGLMVLAGFAAGVVNTLAGSGSVFTLSILLFAGLPASLANGTNRVGVVFQSLIGVTTFYKHRHFGIRESWAFAIPCVIGATIGAWTAVDINQELLEKLFGGVMLLLLPFILADPKKKLKNEEAVHRLPSFWRFMIFTGVGFYGGFIQAGVGIFLLVSLVLSAGMDLVRANGIKLFVVFAFSIPTLVLFIYYQQIHWEYAAFLTLGQVAGAFVASRFAVKSTQANLWIKRLLVGMILLTALKMFGILEGLFV